MACRITCLSIDSRFADQFYDGTAEFMIRLPSIMRNVSRISLASIELPQVAYVFSVRCGNTAFFYDMSGVRYTGTIPDGNYRPDELATAVTDAIDISGVVVSYNSITNRFSITNNGGTPFVLTLAASYSGRARYWGLGYWMGFRLQTFVVNDAGLSIVAPSAPVLTPPAYALVQLQCPDMMENTLHRIETGSYVQALAKIVLRPTVLGAGFYAVQYDDGSNDVKKENVFPSPTALSQLRFRLVDAYGVTIDIGDTDWSLTLEVTEIVSSLGFASGKC